MSFIYPTKEANGSGSLVTALMKTTPVGTEANKSYLNQCVSNMVDESLRARRRVFLFYKCDCREAPRSSHSRL